MGSSRDIKNSLVTENIRSTRIRSLWTETERETYLRGSDQEACGAMHTNLLPLSVGLILIHWSCDQELSVWSRPGGL